ncbi:MAG TPA: acyl-CoA thioesterase [Lentisphaeria bacterium]|nr:MAG: acyl-CoA thioesterase [Lentisphaerae bacterium GWF2_38_69]HBM16853.1 acyl-CoA thioesterase [Lentisphaeria bacterium]
MEKADTVRFDNYKVIKPEDLNHYGYLFGGKLLQWVDEFSWIAASIEFPNHSFVTLEMDKVEFRRSVRQGAILQFAIEKIYQGRASVKYQVKVFVKNDPAENHHEIFRTNVTFVSVDSNQKIRPIFTH